MTVSTVYQPVTFTGNGVTTDIPFPYTFYNNTDLLVQLVLISTGVPTTQTLGVDYTVSGGSGAGGTVTFTTAPSALYRGVIQYIPDLLQGTNFVDNDPLFADDVEEALDKNVLANQHINAEVDRALKFPATDPSASRGEIPNSVARANAILSFDANGVPSAVTLASLGADINVSLTSPQNGDVMTYNAGSWLNRSVLASLGTNIASAATTNLGSADSDFVTITGTTGITSFGTPASLSRKHIWAVFAGVVTITHNATTLILPGAANYTTAAGDVLECVHISGANWRVVAITKANGQAVVAPSSGPTLGTPVATTSGTAIDFTGIPTGIKQIFISFENVSAVASDNFLIQIGDSGGVETTGYETSSIVFTASTTGAVSNFTNAILQMDRNGLAVSGVCILTLIDSSTNTWAGNFTPKSGTTRMNISTGIKSLSATLDRVRLTTTGGSTTFNAGKMNIQYQ